MKVGDLVKHYQSMDYGIVVQRETIGCDQETIRWKVAWVKWGHVGWIYNPNLLEVVSESR